MARKRRKPAPIGIDIGATGVKVLQLVDGPAGVEVVAAAYCTLAPAIDDFEAGRPRLKQAIVEALRQDRFVGRKVATALGAKEIGIKNIRLPRMPMDELLQAAEFEAADRFEFPSDSAQIRCLPAGEVRHGNEIRDEVIVFGAPNDRVERLLDLFSELRLEVVGLDVAPCAVARSFARFLRRAEDASSVNIFLDVGWRATSIIMIRGTQLVFVKVIDVGGRAFETAVAKALAVPVEEAAHLRLRIMRQSSDRRRQDATPVGDDLRNTVADAIRPAVQRLCREINLCLRYFSVTFRGQRPDCLTLVGGDAYEPVLSAVLDEALDIPCLIGHPLRGILGVDRIGGPDRRTLQPAWATATGLALRHSEWVPTMQAESDPLPQPVAPAVGAA